MNLKVKKDLRPSTSKTKYSGTSFDKLTVRSSSKYQTYEDVRLEQEKQSRLKQLGRSRMVFSGKMKDNEINCYITQSPSTPPTMYKYRDIDKAKWLNKDTFLTS